MLSKYKNKLAIIAGVLAALLLTIGLSHEVKAFSVSGGNYKSLNSYSGIKKFNYAVKPVRESFINEDMVDGEYTFRLGSKAVDSYFGKITTYTDTDGVKRKGCFLDNNEKGKCGVRYDKLFQYNSTWIDVKTTYVSWSLQDKKKAFAAGGFCNIWWTGVKWLKMKHEFFISGTNTPIKVNGFFTYIDVDDEQGLGIPSAQIKKMWVNSKGTILNYKKEDNITMIKSDDVIIPNRSHSDYNPQKAATATFSYQFSGTTHTQYVLDGNAGNSNNVIGFDAAKYIPSQIPQAKPPGIEKSVSDEDETDVRNNTVPTLKKSWTYSINGLVPLETEAGNFYDGFRFIDTLDSCLEIRDVKVYRDNSINVTDQFTVSRSGQTVTATARNYRDASFYGRNYQLRIKVNVKEGISKETLKAHGHYNSGTDSWFFQNMGKVAYKDSTGETVRNTNSVSTEIPIPVLTIAKSAEKQEYQVGDLVHYTVKITQTRAKAEAVNLVISDTSLPEDLTLDPGSVKVTNLAGAKIAKQDNGFEITADSLPYGKTVLIQYSARAEKSAANKDITNTVFLTADFSEKKSAQATVHVLPFNIACSKTWEDREDQDGIRPEHIEVTLLADEKPVRTGIMEEKADWNYVFEDLNRFDPQGNEIKYRVEEKAIAGYVSRVDGFHLINQHTPEQVTISGEKTWNDVDDRDRMRPRRAVVYLLADGQRIKSETISRETNWRYQWKVDKYRNKGQQIQYTIEEKAVEGYVTTVNGYDLVNTHVPYEIRLTKYEALENGTETEKPLAGAEFLAYRADEPDEYLGKYKTDEKGMLCLKGIQPGNYYFVEEQAPPGYWLGEGKFQAEVKAHAGGERLESPVITEVKVHNQRKYGSIQFVKKDDKGNSVEDAAFGLYEDKDCSRKIKTFRTDRQGIFEAGDIPWGTYYLREDVTPKGYESTDRIWTIEIDADRLEHTIQGINRQKKGAVILTKTDETQKIRLKGAVYDLYLDSGKLEVENLKTDDQGQIRVEGLAWGSYYFKEKKAPEGYGLSEELVRFAVNSTTGGITQEVQATDPVKQAELTVIKKLRAADIHYDHGTPGFVFKVSGNAENGPPEVFYQMITFSEEYVKAHTDAGGNVEKKTVFSAVKTGRYTVEELSHIRYGLSDIESLSSNGQTDGAKAAFDLRSQQEGSVTFVNEKTDWQDYSHIAARTNMIKMQRKLTGLAVACAGDKQLEGNSLFPKSELGVVAVYDDGTERELLPEEYSLHKEDGTVLERVPKTAGNYLAIVTCTENGITVRQSVTYSVEAVKMQTVNFRTKGGESLPAMIVEKYSSLSDYEKESYTPVRQGYSFTGWYEDDQLTLPFSTQTEITEDKCLYASWQMKHLEDYSWEEIKKIADSGAAETVFAECFEKVKEDLKDGSLTADSFKHTKAFSLNGKTCHAMLMGFNQDIKTDGSKAGISFLTYESAMTSVYNQKMSNEGGWEASLLREKLKNLVPELPRELAGALSEVQKTSYTRRERIIEKTTTQDKLWLLSQSELYGAWGYDNEQLEPSIYHGDGDYGELKSIKGEGQQYKLFREVVPDGAAEQEAMPKVGFQWWLRSFAAGTEDGFCFVDEKGAAR